MLWLLCLPLRVPPSLPLHCATLQSRVVLPGHNERSFHIFYQFLTGIDQATLDENKLERDTSKYTYLSLSDCSTVEGIDDKEGYKETSDAMTVVKFSAKEKADIWKILAVILHLGNIEFEEVASDYGANSGSEIASDIDNIVAILGADEDEMSAAFTT